MLSIATSRLMLLVITMLYINISYAIEVRNIIPPNLNAKHLGRKISAYRPMRHGTIAMSVEKVGDKIVANNYGHGGSGWTLGPGTADYVNNMLINSPYAKDLQKNTPITIIGAGALGLYSAYDLYSKGYINLTIVADKFDDLTSHNAGGLLAPVSMDNNPEIQKVIDKIGIDAYKFYASIAKHTNIDFKNGAIIVPTYFENREESGLEPYVNVVMQPAKDVVLDFGNGTQHKMVAYDDGIFIDTASMMNNLTIFLKSKNVKFIHKKINNFAEINSKFIINCPGLGAVELNSDPNMVSVQGHLIMLKDQNPADMQYMILTYFGSDKTKSGQNIKRSFYVFPKRFSDTPVNDVGVIGGTFVEGATDATPNSEEFDIMLAGARKFYGL